MNIRKIIREEMDDSINWIKNVKPNFYCENLGELKPGDVVEVNGRIKRDYSNAVVIRGTTFKNDIGVVLSVSNSDRKIYINGELKIIFMLRLLLKNGSSPKDIV